MALEPVIVDAHSHIFNAEDLPIDGFVKELSPVPGFLTGLVSGPLDALTSWLAPGPSNETEAIIKLLTEPDGAGFAVPDTSRWAQGSDLGQPDDAAVAGGFVVAETSPTAFNRADLDAAIDAATDDELAELDAWLAEWDDPEETEVADAGFGIPKFLRVDKAARAVGRYIKVLKLITRYRYLVGAEVATTYPEVELFVPALVDFTAATDDRPATKVREQVRIHSFVSKLSVAGKLPGAPKTRIHPLVGYDPLREIDASLLSLWKPDSGQPNRYVPFGELVSPDEQDRFRLGMEFDLARAREIPAPAGRWEERAPQLDNVHRSLDIVRHAIEHGGFAGVKIYPPTGFFPLGNEERFPGAHGQRLDTAMRALYAYCVAMDVPILTHAAHSNGFKKDYDKLAGPRGWELVLAEFPSLRVCFGHFGHLHAVGNDPEHPSDHSWPSRFTALIDRYPNVFADVGNSKLPAKDGYKRDFTKLLRSYLGEGSPTTTQAKRRKRLLYGSDYWMNMMAPSHDDFLKDFDQLMADEFDEATRASFMGLNALRWLGFADDDGEIVTDNRNRQRLLAFYGDHDKPAWLTGA
jgi:predicted TIM-barrel fold metal-dependent hydrolase